MKLKSSALIMGAILVGAVGLSGCATKSFVRDQVAAEDQRVNAQDSQINGRLDQANGRLDQNDARLAGLDQTSREALQRAVAAGKLAEGKFLYAMVLSDDSVKFPVDRASLSPEAEARLMDLITKLKTDNHNVYLEIQGHTDATGPATTNMKLGEARAEAVRLFMNQQGVALNRMSTISYGATAPVADNKTRQGRAQNRRVVVIVLA